MTSAGFAGDSLIMFDGGRDYRHCASMCLQLAMQAMRHEDRSQVDPAVSVRSMCRDICRSHADQEGLTDTGQAAIMAETLDGLQKPPSWGLPGDE